MCCAVRNLPVTGFLSDHPFSMSDRSPTSPQPSRDEALPLRTLPSTELTQKPEPSQIPAEHSHSSHDREHIDHTQRTSLSPGFRHRRPQSSSPSNDQGRPTTSRSTSSTEQALREQSYSAASVVAQDTVPAGQICR